jgi:hypothetical protein
MGKFSARTRLCAEPYFPFTQDARPMANTSNAVRRAAHKTSTNVDGMDKGHGSRQRGARGRR